MEDPPLSRTFRRSRDTYAHADSQTTKKRSRERDIERPFRCVNCKAMVGLVPWGGKHRNHCPYCLHSRHVDGKTPGDRANECGGKMAPVAHFTRRNGEYAIVHRCLSCRFERYNRIAADDYFELVLSLPLVDPRPARPAVWDEHEELSA